MAILSCEFGHTVGNHAVAVFKRCFVAVGLLERCILLKQLQIHSFGFPYSVLSPLSLMWQTPRYYESPCSIQKMTSGIEFGTKTLDSYQKKDPFKSPPPPTENSVPARPPEALLAARLPNHSPPVLTAHYPQILNSGHLTSRPACPCTI